MEEASRVLARAVRARPGEVSAQYGLGFAYLSLGRSAEALEAFDKSVALNPQYVEAHTSRAVALALLGRRDDALRAANRALALNPQFVIALNIRAEILRGLGTLEASLADSDRSLSLVPDQASALNNRGHALYLMGRLEAALAALDRAIQLKPDYIDAICNRGSVLRNLGRPEDALADMDKVVSLKPDFGEAAGERLYLRSLICAWSGRDGDLEDLATRIRKGQKLIPWEILVAIDDPELQRKPPKVSPRNMIVAAPAVRRGRRNRLRIAYLSPDFRDHPTGYQVVELMERHDRQHYEICGVCLNSVPDDPARKRLKQAFDSFVEAGSRSDDELVQILRKQEIDIVVDLAGYVGMGRTRALAARPAPIAVNYFGYPGTLGCKFIDYIISDARVTPPDSDQHFAEKVVRLPDCYYPNDTTFLPDAPPSRADAGLPDGFVFCCFNNTYKITPQMFDIWMRLLQRIEGSILWLFAENEAARRNLRKEAMSRGVPADRLVFAERVGHRDHLARLGWRTFSSIHCHAMRIRPPTTPFGPGYRFSPARGEALRRAWPAACCMLWRWKSSLRPIWRNTNPRRWNWRSRPLAWPSCAAG